MLTESHCKQIRLTLPYMKGVPKVSLMDLKASFQIFISGINIVNLPIKHTVSLYRIFRESCAFLWKITWTGELLHKISLSQWCLLDLSACNHVRSTQIEEDSGFVMTTHDTSWPKSDNKLLWSSKFEKLQAPQNIAEFASFCVNFCYCKMYKSWSDWYTTYINALFKWSK